MIDPLYDLAKEINCPADAYEENPEADAEQDRQLGHYAHVTKGIFSIIQ